MLYYPDKGRFMQNDFADLKAGIDLFSDYKPVRVKAYDVEYFLNLLSEDESVVMTKHDDGLFGLVKVRSNKRICKNNTSAD